MSSHAIKFAASPAPSPMAADDASLRGSNHSIQSARQSRSAARSFLKLLVVGLGGFAAAVSASAALWQSSGWVLHSEGSARLSYDSNIYGREGGDGDTVALLEPSLWLERYGSLTKLELHGDLAINRFFDNSDEDSVDPAFRLDYGFPQSEEELLKQEARIVWRRQSYPDIDVGQRVRRTEMSARWDGRLRDTGKSVIRGLAGYSSFKNDRYDATDENAQVGVSIGYVPHDLLELAGGARYVSARYESDIGIPTVERKALDLFVRARGELLAKVTGNVEFGATHNSFEGVTGGRDWDWRASCDVSWTPTELRVVTIGLSRETYFSVDGGLGVNTGLNVGFSQHFAGGFRAELRAGTRNVDRSDRDFSYDVNSLGASLAYDLTGRFFGEIGADWESVSSDFSSYDFSRNSVFGRVGYRY